MRSDDPSDEEGHLLTVLRIPFDLHQLLFLRPAYPDVPVDEDGGQSDGEGRGPPEDPSEQHEDEAEVLGIAGVAIDAAGDEPSVASVSVECDPSDDDEDGADDHEERAVRHGM